MDAGRCSRYKEKGRTELIKSSPKNNEVVHIFYYSLCWLWLLKITVGVLMVVKKGKKMREEKKVYT